MLIVFYYFLNLSIAITETVVISSTRAIKYDEYPGLWYLVIAVMTSRFLLVLIGFFSSCIWQCNRDDESCSQNRREEFKEYRESSLKFYNFICLFQSLFSFACFCTLVGIRDSSNLSDYYTNNYSSLYYTIIGETIIFFFLVLYVLYSKLGSFFTKCSTYCSEQSSKTKLEEEVKQLRILVSKFSEKENPPSYQTNAYESVRINK